MLFKLEENENTMNKLKEKIKEIQTQLDESEKAKRIAKEEYQLIISELKQENYSLFKENEFLKAKMGERFIGKVVS